MPSLCRLHLPHRARDPASELGGVRQRQSRSLSKQFVMMSTGPHYWRSKMTQLSRWRMLGYAGFTLVIFICLLFVIPYRDDGQTDWGTPYYTPVTCRGRLVKHNAQRLIQSFDGEATLHIDGCGHFIVWRYRAFFEVEAFVRDVTPGKELTVTYLKPAKHHHQPPHDVIALSTNTARYLSETQLRFVIVGPWAFIGAGLCLAIMKRHIDRSGQRSGYEEYTDFR